MRAILVPLLLALALPAAAQQSGDGVRPASTAAPLPKPGLRTADQCRAECARDYYFCLAESDEEVCAPAWTLCRLACGKTP